MECVPSLVFLHIPKTAGQSVHHFLESLVEPKYVAPARVNEQLAMMSVPEIRRYRVFSGHFDWCLLDCLESPKFVFTVLRNPMERIISFYLFMRRDAQTLSPKELSLPQNEAKRAVLSLSCDEYLTGGNYGLRIFLDNHFDNFYTYYFAGRSYDARQKFICQKQIDGTFTDDKILDMAFANINTLGGIYTVEQLHRLEDDIQTLTGITSSGISLNNLRLNAGNGASTEERLAQLGEFGATRATFDKIREMTIFDQQIWQHFSQVGLMRPGLH